MTTISAKVIAHSSANPLLFNAPDLFTMELVYPRCIHSEFMTHRVFSRNASSSRAIPVEKQIQMIRSDPFIPLYWGKNQKGMQADKESDEKVVTGVKRGYAGIQYEVIKTNFEAWIEARDSALHFAEAFNKAGYHKQIVNRLLEPFAHIKVVVSGTDWSNFFDLRIHKDAEPHIQILAQRIKQSQEMSAPYILSDGEWHLPYIKPGEWEQYDIELLKKVSSARCARVSYLNFDGTNPDIKSDVALFERLAGSAPIHASPLEHQATPTRDRSEMANLNGYKQFRREIENG